MPLRRPMLLALDERTTGLDPVARHDILRELTSVMVEEGCTILFSSQNTQDVEQISDQITFIDRGRSCGRIRGVGHNCRRCRQFFLLARLVSACQPRPVSLTRTWVSPVAVWSTAARNILGVEFIAIVLILALTRYLQSRKRNFV